MEALRSYSRDPDVYPDPETFDPERFLQDGKLRPGARDPYAYIFGLGRRCAATPNRAVRIRLNLI